MTVHDRPEPAHRQPCSNATRQVRADAELRFIWIDGGIATRTHARTASAEKSHTFATSLANAGMSLQALMALLGHSSPDMTLRYARLASPTVKAAYDQAISKLADSHLGRGPTPSPRTRSLAAFGDAQDPCRPRVLFAEPCRRGVPLRKHLRDLPQLCDCSRVPPCDYCSDRRSPVTSRRCS